MERILSEVIQLIRFCLSLKRLERINEIFEIYFSHINQYSLRIKISLSEYENREIDWSLKHLKLYIWITIRSLLVVAYLWIMIFWNDCPIPGVRYLSTMIPIDHYDLLFIFYSIIILWIEILSFILIRLLIRYDFRLYHALNNLIQTDHNDDELMGRIFLQRFLQKYRKILLFLTIVYRSQQLLLLGIYLFVIEDLRKKFIWKKMTSIEIFFAIFLNHFLYKETIFIAGTMCFEQFGFAVTGNYYLIRFQNFVKSFRKIFSQSKSLKQYKNLTKYFNEYLHQSTEISLMNHSTRECFFIIEMMSKCSIVFAMFFYDNQTKLNLYSFSVLFAIGLFCLINAIFCGRVSAFNTWNSLFFRSIISWQSRLQFKFSQQKLSKKQALLIDEIRKNFFIQNIPNNPIGFSCGQIFRITKFKYIETQLMNGILLLLFYKRFLL